jgi:hypothetical protein
MDKDKRKVPKQKNRRFSPGSSGGFIFGLYGVAKNILFPNLV